MNAGTTLDKQINEYLVRLNTNQKKAVLTVVKTFVEDQEHGYSWDKDTDFVEELDRRTSDLQNGKVKGHSWEEVKQKARQSLKPQKKR